MDRRLEDALFENIDGIGWYTVDPDKPMELCRRTSQQRKGERRSGIGPSPSGEMERRALYDYDRRQA